MKNVGLPKFLQSVLWSYDLSKMDRNRNRDLIIGQGLNWGGDDVIAWIKENYSDNQIKKVISHPRRGMWFRERLQKWLDFYKMKIDPLFFEVAIIDLNPSPERTKLLEEYFDRIGVKSPVTSSKFNKHD